MKLDEAGVRALVSAIKPYITVKMDQFSVDNTLSLLEKQLSVETPVRRILTQAEYDALPQEEQTRGLYIISDGEDTGGGGESPGPSNYDRNPTHILWLESTTLSDPVVGLDIMYPIDSFSFPPEVNDPVFSFTKIIYNEDPTDYRLFLTYGKVKNVWTDQSAQVSTDAAETIFDSKAGDVTPPTTQLVFGWKNLWMTGNEAPHPYKATAYCTYTDTSTTYYPYKAFNGDRGDFWHNCIGNTNPIWLQIDFGTKTILGGIRIFPRINFLNQFPKIFNVLGSDDGNTWATIMNVQTLSTTIRDGFYEYLFDEAVNYRYYRFADMQSDTGNVSFAEMEFYVGTNSLVSSPPLDIYSTEETRIGTWIDGKPLYRICVYKKAPIAFAGTMFLRTFDEQFDIVSMYGCMYATSGHALPLTSGYFYTGPSSSAMVTVLYNRPYKRLEIHTNGGDLKENGYVTVILEYTKPTDQPEVRA